jgi:hypothetical protein
MTITLLDPSEGANLSHWVRLQARAEAPNLSGPKKGAKINHCVRLEVEGGRNLLCWVP